MTRTTLKKAQNWYQQQTPPVRRVVIFVGIIFLWMLTGIFNFSSGPAPKEPALFKVAAHHSTAKDIEHTLVLRGEIEPDRTANIAAETAGRIAELRLPKGSIVQRGDVLLTLAPDSRVKKVEEARANLTYFEKEFKTAQSLEQKGFQARNSLASARADLERARANLADMELDFSNSQIKAPFDGIYEDRLVDVGDSVALGAKLVKIIDIDPLVLKGFVPQNAINQVETARPVKGQTLSGTEVEGQIRYLANQADAVTRTYAIEVAVPNPMHLRLAGSSVTMNIPMGLEKAHFISSAFLSLAADGTMGVKGLDDENKVVFYPAEIIRSEAEGVWLAGLPEKATLITVGHGFVSEGQEVDPVFDESAATETSNTDTGNTLAQSQKQASTPSPNPDGTPAATQTE